MINDRDFAKIEKGKIYKDDYIKRKDVIAMAWNAIYEDEFHMHRLDKVVSVSDIAKLPAADVVKRKRAKWVLYNKGFGFTHYCSNCNFEVKEQWIDFYNYCPNCGADMREEK